MQLCGQPWSSTTSAPTLLGSLSTSLIRPAVQSSSTAAQETGSEQQVSPTGMSALTHPLRRPPDHRKKTQTAVVWSCLPFIGCSQNHLARHSERGRKTRQTEKEMGRQHQGMDRPAWVCQVPEGGGEQRETEETGSEVICGAPTTLAVNGWVKVKVKPHQDYGNAMWFPYLKRQSQVVERVQRRACKLVNGPYYLECARRLGRETQSELARFLIIMMLLHVIQFFKLTDLDKNKINK